MMLNEFNIADDYIRFRIVPTSYSASGAMRGTLFSPLLDTTMLPSYRVDIFISLDPTGLVGMHEHSAATARDLGGSLSEPLMLNPFQLESLRSFLLNQLSIRSILENNLKRERNTWTHREVTRLKENIWEDVEIECLVLEHARPRRRANSWFMLQISFPWDPEHGPRIATFQNGSLVELGVT